MTADQRGGTWSVPDRGCTADLTVRTVRSDSLDVTVAESSGPGGTICLGADATFTLTGSAMDVVANDAGGLEHRGTLQRAG